MRKIKILAGIVAFIVLVSFTKGKNASPKITPMPKGHFVYSGGITGYTAAGCVCHGGASTAPTVNLIGLPTSPIVGTVYPLTLTITGPNPAVGFNLAASNGDFTDLGADVQQIGTELTHNGSPSNLIAGTHSFTFNWEPTAPGNVTFDFAINNVNLDGGTGLDLWRQRSVTVPVQTLPVKILYFNGFNNKQANSLVWKIEKEDNFKSYEIQESCNGTTFTTVNTMLPQTNSSIIKTYQFEHTTSTCSNTKSFYSLKINNLDNSYEYSSVIAIEKTKKEVTPTLYPNPVIAGQGTLYVFGNIKNITQMAVYNASGSLLKTYINTATSLAEINLPATLTPGNYYLQLRNKNNSKTTLPFVVQ